MRKHLASARFGGCLDASIEMLLSSIAGSVHAGAR